MPIDKKTLERARLAYISKEYKTIRTATSAFGLKTTTLHLYLQKLSNLEQKPAHHNALLMNFQD
jgi:hypothetical protein